MATAVVPGRRRPRHAVVVQVAESVGEAHDVVFVDLDGPRWMRSMALLSFRVPRV